MQLIEINELKKEIENFLNENKASEVKSINLKDKTSIADYMIVPSGNSSRHIQALSEMLLEKLKKNGIDVVLVARGEHYKNIKENGLVFKSEEYNLDICQKFDVFSENALR